MTGWRATVSVWSLWLDPEGDSPRGWVYDTKKDEVSQRSLNANLTGRAGWGSVSGLKPEESIVVLSRDSRGPTRTYLSPVAFHFTAVLFVSAVALVPEHTPASLSLLLGVSAGVGVVYAAFVTRRLLSDGIADLPDRLAYGLSPLIAYAAILAAAQKAFETRGYADVGIRDIAAAAGINSALVLRYFGSKELLFRAALTDALDVEPLIAGDKARFGKTVVGLFLDEPWQNPNSLPMMILATADPAAPCVPAPTLSTQPTSSPS